MPASSALSLRVSAKDRKLIDRAAEALNKTRTEFMLESARAAAPIPIIVMGRLAVDVKFQGRGLGPALLQHALETTQQLAKGVGIRALLVHAKDETAAHFYKRLGFAASTLDPLMLMAKL